MAINLSSTLLLLLVAVATAGSASAHTTVTVVTTTTEAEGNPSCETEIQQKTPMRMCMMWMESKMVPRGDAFLRSAAANPREDYLEECCGELRSFSSGCRCDAVRQMATAMQPYGPMEEMRRMACTLPDKCGISQCSCGGSTA